MKRSCKLELQKEFGLQDCSYNWRHTKRKCFTDLHRMPQNLYPEITVHPALQCFLATVCDLKVNPGERSRLGLRYAKTPEVQRLVAKLERKQYVTSELCSVDPNAIISTMKEILDMFPSGIFNDQCEEFICVPPEAPLETALSFVNGLIAELPHFMRQFIYLICRSLRNLIHQCDGCITDAYTDALLLFTPTFFPNSAREIGRFLRAVRISLILINLCDFVFQPYLLPRSYSDIDGSDDEFFCDILNNLTYLCNWFDSKDDSDDIVDCKVNDDNDDDADADDDDCDNNNIDKDMNCSVKGLPDASSYYHITYLVD